MNFQILASASHTPPAEGDTSAVALPNDADALAQPLDGVTRIDLHFPAFTDGRAFSQAYLLRRRRGFSGEIRATGDVLIDQLVQMQRTGFSSAVLKDGMDAADAQRQFERFQGFYQADAVQAKTHFCLGAMMTSSLLSRGAPAKATTVHARPSADFAAKLEQTRALLRQAAALGAPGAVTQASSLGAEDVVITHLINALELDIPVFVLETGALHTETLALLERTQAHSRAPIVVYKPEFDAVIQFIRQNGQDAMYQSIELRKACCHIRKMEPLARALAGKQGWITGLRREQSNARAEVPAIDTSEVATKGLTKFNPLTDWTLGDVWHYIAENQVDYNPLHDQFFPSIGCAPCTRAISLGEDFRAGRWWWEDEAAKECGLHVKKN